MLTLLGRRGPDAADQGPRPRPDRLHLPGGHCRARRAARNRRLKVPVYSSITDLAGLQFWAHPGIDLHFVTHPESIEEVEGIAGPGSVRWAKPPTSPSFLAARSRADARRALGLPADGRVIAVSGGGWGVGDLSARRAPRSRCEDAIVLCLCGRNDKLRARGRQRLPAEPRLRIMGFTDRMGDVLAAADALVHSSAGLTVLEAIIRGCPVVSYGFGYGHVRASNPRSSASGWPRSRALSTSWSRSCATSPASGVHRTPPLPRCPRSPRGSSRRARACAPSPPGACAWAAPRPRSASP